MIKIPILTYHSIDRSGSIVSTAPETFRRQMKFLREDDYAVVSLKTAIEFLENKTPCSPKTVALTFDDGFQNFYAEAFPVLAEYDFRATVFLVTDCCGKYNDWAGNPPNLPRSQLLAWREIRELNEHRIEFGSHTRTHPDLTRLSLADARRELTESKAIIEGKLGAKVTTLAYPFGCFDPPVKKIAAQNFAAACSVNLGKARVKSDFFSLERIDAYYLSNQKLFAALSTKPFDYYLHFRQSLRNFKSLVRGV